MAGIEKICEISGEYCGNEMYEYKHHLIQIKPEFRKLFKNCKAILHKFKEEKPDPRATQSYCLEVFDKNLQGSVGGLYYNYYSSRELKWFGNGFYGWMSIVRRMRRLTNDRKLTVVRHNHKHYESCENCKHNINT